MAQIGEQVILDDGCTAEVVRVERGRVYGQRIWPGGKRTKFSTSGQAWAALVAEAEAEEAFTNALDEADRP